MSVNPGFFDVQLLSLVRDSVSEITDLSFAIYDCNGVLLIPPKSEDKLTVQIKSYIKKEFEEFIRDGIEKAAMRRDPFLHKGPASEYHLFMSAGVDDLKLVFVSNAFYPSRTEFEDFLIKHGERLGLLPSHLELWLKAVKMKDFQTVEKMAAQIKPLFETFLQCSYEKNLNYKGYRWSKTLIDVVFSIQLPVTTEEVYSLILDVILFLFNVETVSIMVKEKDVFKTLMSSGRLRSDVKFLCLENRNPMISQSIEGCKPVYINDVVEILRFGFPGTITSMYIFPLSHNSSTYGLVVIYNSVISAEESLSILEFCKLVSLVLKNLTLQNAYDKCIDDMEILNIASTKLTLQLHNPEALHEAILDTATKLLKAEKGSLMLFEGDSLVIKVVKGINRLLVQDTRIKRGEGIAGKVFRDGKPLFIRDFEEMELLDIKPKSRYRTGSFMSVPLIFGSETIGILNISDKITGERFTESDLNLINRFASSASITLKIFNYYNLVEQMKELSITDPLTGIFNRRFLRQRFIEEIHRSERYDTIFSLAIFDIDDFKLFNDTEGHLAGDSVLKELARIARRCIRVNDILSRFGGEEFAILMPQTNKEEAFLVAERIRKSIRESSMYKWEKFPRSTITVSMGITSFPHNGKSIDELIKHADIALYKAKSMGKDRTVVYSDQNA